MKEVGISKMAKELSLMAVPRTVLGKQVKALRREGLVPGVVYGPAVAATIQVSVNRRELEKFYVSYGHSALFTLNWETGSQQVFIKEVQVEPVRRAPLHVDFFAPNLKKELTSKVQVVLSHADEHAEGVLTQLVNEIEVRALPSEIPHQIDVNISSLLHAHDGIRAGEISLPAGVTLVTDPEIVVAMMLGEAGATAEEAADDAAAEAAAEASDAASE